MPLVSKAFGDIITFTRASTATYFDSAGVLQSAAIDAPRLDYDPSTLAAQGLLIEEARTNLCLQSADFATTWTTSASPTITTNTTVAPDGTTTADTIASTSISSYVAQIVTFTGDGTKAYSFFIKAGTSSNTRIFLRDTTASVSRGQADITWAAGVPSVVVTSGSLQYLQACPNGWYRLAVIVDSVVAANTNQLRIQPDNVSGTGDVIFWGAQIENAAFSTSYIPTTTTALTRSADVASVNTLSPWYNATEGTLYVEYQTYSASVTQIAVALMDTVGSSNRATVGQSTTAYNGAMVDGGVVQASLTQGTSSTNVVKNAFAFAVNDFAFSVNGAAPATDTSGTVSSAFTEMQLGKRGSTSPLSGYLRRITYYPRKLSSAELQAITA